MIMMIMILIYYIILAEGWRQGERESEEKKACALRRDQKKSENVCHVWDVTPLVPYSLLVPYTIFASQHIIL